MKDPVLLQRIRNQRKPDMPCREFLVQIIDRKPTLEEAAADLGISRQTLMLWRRRYGMEVGK